MPGKDESERRRIEELCEGFHGEMNESLKEKFIKAIYESYCVPPGTIAIKSGDSVAMIKGIKD